MARSDAVPHIHMHSCSSQHFELGADIHSWLSVPFLGCLFSPQQEPHRDAGCLLCAPYLSLSLGMKDAVLYGVAQTKESCRKRARLHTSSRDLCSVLSERITRSSLQGMAEELKAQGL